MRATFTTYPVGATTTVVVLPTTTSLILILILILILLPSSRASKRKRERERDQSTELRIPSTPVELLHHFFDRQVYTLQSRERPIATHLKVAAEIRCRKARSFMSKLFVFFFDRASASLTV